MWGHPAGAGGVISPGAQAAQVDTSGAPWLSEDEMRQSAQALARLQRPDGFVVWHEGGQGDPWNHVEAAMALALGGMVDRAEAAYDWLIRAQRADGSWCARYMSAGIAEPASDTNFCAYVATGAWLHYLVTSDRRFLDRMWPAVKAAVEFVLSHQRPDGTIPWQVRPGGRAAPTSLVAASCSVVSSLAGAQGIAGVLGEAEPTWGPAAARLASALRSGVGRYLDKRAWAMEWYYPVLSGVVPEGAAKAWIEGHWAAFVAPGAGIRCIRGRDWITSAETAECVLALLVAGMDDEAGALMSLTRRLRCPDGSYLTGAVTPGWKSFPSGQRSSYSTAAVMLASASFDPASPVRSVFGTDRARSDPT